MSKGRSWLMIIFCAVAFAAIGQAQQSAGNKWETEIVKFEQSDKQYPPPKGAVIFIGSSSIQMWQSLAEDFPGIKVVNRGFGGSELADSTFYVDRLVTPLRPKMVILYAGDNDLANRKSPQQVFEDYKAFVERVQQKLPGTKIGFISIKPSPARVALLQSVKEANLLIKTYAADHKGLLYIDVFTPMLGKDGGPRPELFGPDRLHMTREGYELWKSVIGPFLH
jgi:lysophospholipase L1-like esterase